MKLWSNQESSEAKDKAIEELLNRASEAWLRANVSLFKHMLDYKVKLDVSLDRTGGWIRVQEEHIWMTMVQITEDLRAPLCAGLAIVFHLLDTLPSFPVNLMYQSASPHHHRVHSQSLCSAALAGAQHPIVDQEEVV